MSAPPDAYKVLQVDSEADPEVIQAAYRRLAQKFHPDLAGGAETAEGLEAARRMVAINAAWEVLGNEARRAAYDHERAVSAGTVGRPVPTQTPAPRPAPVRTSTRAAADDDTLNFGRYNGWRLEEILGVDPGYLEWLARAPIGRSYRAEIDILLRRIGRRARGSEGSAGLPRR